MKSLAILARSPSNPDTFTGGSNDYPRIFLQFDWDTSSLVRGRLKACRNPQQIPIEKELRWERAMKEKHETS